MDLSPGERLGPYEILARIGAGGMGEVWKARDSRLDRAVAIKICAGQFSDRFDREARAVAALNHPNVCTIHDVGPNYLVMELVEGPSLADRIAAGRIPLDEAVALARQIAEALEAAHEKGIIHRDLKPANIKLTGDGKVKVLDFGLAKAFDTGHGAADPANSPTLTMSATLTGAILGTAGYMSPEQARGMAVDKRSDIWSFGCVAYEMLTGGPAFPGLTVVDLLAAVMTREVQFDAIPEHLRPIVAKCLRRDPKQRWRDIGDVRMALDEAKPAEAPAEAPMQTASRRVWIAAAGSAAFGAVAGSVATSLRQPPTSEAPALHLQIAPPPGEEFISGGGDSAISPDGRMIAFVASANGATRLWIRTLDSTAARSVEGTDGAQLPFWSPDSRSVGFFADGKIQRSDLASGQPAVIAEAPFFRGAAWSLDGTIVFAPNTLGGFHGVPASGGAVTPLTPLDPANGELSHRWPLFLPNSRQFLYFVRSSHPKRSGIYLGSLDQPRDKTFLAESTSAGRYCPPASSRPGYLLFVKDEKLVAQPFDPRGGTLSGHAQQVPGGDRVPRSAVFNLADFSVSSDGKILLGGSGGGRQQLAWLSRDGKILKPVLPSNRYAHLRLSPDGTRCAVVLDDASGNRELWLVEFAREIQTRLAGGDIVTPIWAAGGKSLVYCSFGVPILFEKDASGAGPAKQLLRAEHPVFPSDSSPDGRYLIYEDVGDSNLWLLPLGGDAKPVPFLTIPGLKWNGSFSPDGKWVAYTSNESGPSQIYVRSFPASASQRWQASSNGGNLGRWRHDGRELFYVAPDRMLMAVPVRPNRQGLDFGTPAPLFRLLPSAGPLTYGYDVSHDGQRILTLVPAKAVGGAPLTLIMNWQSALKP